jgi:hypothetical protein
MSLSSNGEEFRKQVKLQIYKIILGGDGHSEENKQNEREQRDGA